MLFNCSIQDNIAYGLDGKASMAEVENAAVCVSNPLILQELITVYQISDCDHMYFLFFFLIVCVCV